MAGKWKYTLIEVKQEHIDKGVMKSCSNCPVALAVADHFDAPVHVDDTYIRIYGSKPIHVSHEYLILPELNNRIRSFDNGHGDIMDQFTIRLSEFPGIRNTAEVYSG